MKSSLRSFAEQLSASGLLTQADVQTFVEGLDGDDQGDKAELLEELVRQEKLTPYQAGEIRSGNERSLTIGNYVVLDKLGQGGMGVVLKARHKRMKRLVALKILPHRLTDSPEAMQRFQREVEAAAKLEHPNIVAAYDADEADGVQFLAMQYIEGRDLDQLIQRQGPLPVDQAVSCIVQAARGLDYAHARGVIHRDVKPSNILLDREGVVKVLDMGLARLDSAGLEQDQLTGTGQVMGTADYMAPEQARDTRKADARADVYSLGVTLWRLLTGEPMYPGDSVFQRMLAHQQEPIPSLRDTCPNVPEALEAIFIKMVAKSPEARYQNMTDVITDLEPWQAGDSAKTLVSDAPTAKIPSDHIVMLEPSEPGVSPGPSGQTTANPFDTDQHLHGQKTPPPRKPSTGSPFSGPPTPQKPAGSTANRLAMLVILFTIGGGVLGCGCFGYLLLMPAIDAAREAARRVDCQNNMKQISIALLNYQDTHKTFPPAITTDSQGAPMHSWRVYLLPFLQQEHLYAHYRFDEPWNGPNNSRLMSQCPEVFRCSSDHGGANSCSYRVVMGESTPWGVDRSSRPADITDGMSNTIAFVEVKDSTSNWLEPQELDFDSLPKQLNAPGGIGSNHPHAANAAMFDGSVRLLEEDVVDQETLEFMLRGNDGYIPGDP